MKRNSIMPLNLQFFAAAGEGDGGAGDGQQQNNQNQQNTQGQQNNQSGAQTFDYERLAQIVAGKQTATEESVLRGYFKAQGLSKEEAEAAMATFKAEKAKNTPDIGVLQQQAAAAQAQTQKMVIENAAILQGMQLGLDAKTIPYVLKMADLSKVTGEDGKVNEEALKNALSKVLEDIPALKPQTQQSSGFQVGATGQQTQQTSVDDQLDRIFGVKKK